MMLNQEVRGLLNSKTTQGDPSWIFNKFQTSKGQDNSKVKTTTERLSFQGEGKWKKDEVMRRKQGKEGAKMARGKDPCFHPGKFPTQCLMFPLFQDEKRESKKEVMRGSWREK
jgi:hypothetical protein